MKLLLPLFCFLVFSNCIIFAQEEDFQIPDSLVSKTNAELKKLASKIRYKNPKNALVYTETLYKKSTEQKNRIDLIESYFYFGHIAFIQGEYTNAISKINKGIALANTEQDSILQKLYAVRGNTYEAYGQYEEAYDDYERLFRVAKKYNDQGGMFVAETSFAKLKLNNKQYLEALKTYITYYEMPENTPWLHKYSRMSMLIGISDIYLQIQDLLAARKYIDIGLSESEKIKDYDSACYFYTYDGIYQYYKGDIDKALTHFERAENAISSQQSMAKLNIEVFYYAAQCHFKLEDYTTAINTINKAFEIIREENSKTNKTTAEIDFVPFEYLYFLKLLSRCYEGIGDKEKQDFYWNKYSKKKIESEKAIFPINKSIYHLLNVEEENAFINRQIERKNEAEVTVKYLLYALVFLCVIGIGFYFFYRRKDKQKTIAYEALIEKISTLETKNTAAKEHDKFLTKKQVTITDEKTQDILKGLQKFESQELYLDANCNLRFAAKKIKTNATYLSKIINEHKGVNFTDYINNLRIDYTLQRLKADTVFRAYSIKSISQEVGYKSADSFTKHFKKHTSLYPSYYIKKLNQEKS